ncbi:unnamed protein product [Sphenostylis stenocarpa]|uniref:Uncharacterized protein n=1 Tax=Sphenostylis stenocarpa TaxID=92480 RepID=A0AA86S543_9FABA|nr:unnamed protein product [Sphenostylis stenocarpa]
MDKAHGGLWPNPIGACDSSVTCFMAFASGIISAAKFSDCVVIPFAGDGKHVSPLRCGARCLCRPHISPWPFIAQLA